MRPLSTSVVLTKYLIHNPEKGWCCGSESLTKLMGVVQPGERIYRINWRHRGDERKVTDIPRLKLVFGRTDLPRPKMHKSTVWRTFSHIVTPRHYGWAGTAKEY